MTKTTIYAALGGLVIACAMPVSASGGAPALPNGGFEETTPSGFAKGWKPQVGGGAKAEVRLDETVVKSGKRSLFLSNASPMKAFVFGAAYSENFPVKPETTYAIRFWAKGKGAHNCFAVGGFEPQGDRRLYLPSGDFDWREFTCVVNSPAEAKTMTVGFATDDVTSGLWVDDVKVEVAARQLTNIPEKRYKKDFPGMFPRSAGTVARKLVVFDCSKAPEDVEFMLNALQGIVNRKDPSLYLINSTNPPLQDDVWLKYLVEKGHTGEPEKVADAMAVVERYKGAVKGLVIEDPAFPASANVACMLAGVLDVLPVSPALAEQLKARGFPVVEDLRGRWTRNVDAYRWVHDKYWDRMGHHVLAWLHPKAKRNQARDYAVEFKVFCFWVSSFADNEPGSDPVAEEEFVNQLFAETPGNVPVMGWPGFGDNCGIPEYTGVRWMSEYGKWMPGTGFSSNMSVHSAIHPPASAFKQKCHQYDRENPVKVEKDKVYLSLNVLDSGDSHWYWQFHQRKIWADPMRGRVPVGWAMNATLYDALPAVMQWYYENATPRDTFFCFSYMNGQVYASRFRKADRERIWKEYVAMWGDYMAKADMNGMELYDGGWGEKTPPALGSFERYVKGIKNLSYIFADLGRHNNVEPDKAAYMVGKTAVFHTLTQFQVWTASTDLAKEKMDRANKYLLDEITSNTPKLRPAFMTAMAISWYYFPAWFVDLAGKLPPHYVAVSPGQLTHAFVESRRPGAVRK